MRGREDDSRPLVFALRVRSTRMADLRGGSCTALAKRNRISLLVSEGDDFPLLGRRNRKRSTADRFRL